jgi:hypothetical protein
VSAFPLIISRTGDPVEIALHLAIHPVTAGIADVVFNGAIAGERASFDNVGGDQNPGRVADDGHRLLFFIEGLHEAQNVFIAAERIGIEGAAGEEEGVIIVGPGIFDGFIGLYDQTLLLVPEALDGAGFQRKNVYPGAGIPQRVERFEQFRFFDAIGGNGRDPEIFYIGHVTKAALRMPVCKSRGAGPRPVVDRTAWPPNRHFVL